jgi:isopenicillin N synthase-like dioxygenase
VPGLQALRRSDGLWVPVEEVPPRADGALVLMVMVGDTLGRVTGEYTAPRTVTHVTPRCRNAASRRDAVTGEYYAPCKHRVVAPPPGRGERIGLPFLFRGRSDAVPPPRVELAVS